MNSPPEGLSPSPSTPSSGSPSPDDVGLPTPSTSTTGGGGQSHAAHILASPIESQAKRRLPASSSSTFPAREGRENKSRRRERDKDSDRDDMLWKGGGVWDPIQGDVQGHGHSAHSPRVREELVDIAVVEYYRNVYGDMFDDTILKQRNK